MKKNAIRNPQSALRSGFTTGTCAQAAAKASAIMLITQKLINKVNVITASGVELELKVIDQEIKPNSAKCGIVKDSGDDPDATNGIKICAEVKFSNKKGISIVGGYGVGKVTKPGLPIAVGEYAINPVPQKMITKEIEGARYKIKDSRSEKGIEVIVSVPQGKEIANKTFNSKLGIVDGISIIGTTGIVEPRSIDAYKKTLTMELNIIKEMQAQDARFKMQDARIYLVLGYVGERFCQDHKLEPVIKIGDHVGFMLEECAKKNIKEIVLIGHIGKLIKIANGQFNTNIQYGDNRISSIANYAKKVGATKEIIDNILSQTNAEATINILKEAGLINVFDRIADDVVIKATKLTKNKIHINCIILSLEGEVINKKNKIQDSKFIFSIIGVGPGSMEYLLPVAKAEVEKADILIGAKRLLEQFKNFKKEEMSFAGKLNKIIPYIKNNNNKKRITVLVSGDAGLYSLLEKLSKEFNKDEYQVIPGISSMQIAFAKIGESWQDAKIISLHGREIKNLKSEIKSSKKVFLFTDQKNTPVKIAGYLLKNRIKNRRAIVFENLTYADERIIDTDLKKLSRMGDLGLCVMIIKS